MPRNRAASGDRSDADRADTELRLKLLLAHAKLLGVIVDRKQLATARLNLGKVNPADLDATLPDVESLAAGECARLMRIEAGELAACNEAGPDLAMRILSQE